MKKLIVVLPVLILFLTQCLSANEEKHRQLTEDLLMAMRFEKVIMQTMGQLNLLQMAQNQQLKMPDDQAEAQAVQGRIAELIAKELNWEKIKNDYIDLYSKAFTDDELDSLIAFHNSPTGQKYLNEMPGLMIESLKISQKRMSELLPRFLEIVQGSSMGIEKKHDEGRKNPDAVEKDLDIK